MGKEAEALIKIGTPLILEWKKNQEVERYRCKVVEQTESFIYIDYPINEKTGRTEIFSVGTEFSASFVGQDNSVYRFHTEIKEKKLINIPTLMLDYPINDLERIQRRKYVRINASVDTAIHDPENNLAPFTTVTHDISGGGVSIVIPNGNGYEFEEGKLLNVWLVLPLESGSYVYIYSTSRVIRVHHRGEGKKNILSLQFDSIKEKDRQHIIRFCFEMQLKVRRRHLTP
ncbi:flagellar brake protein [Aquibacillus albus]|uniref:C-di-GMP-binding flagellar brake protein YcgR n=1 Tax=Aquibacillus albus TaxID=1168171 RepID=A0ABS2MVI2_9BACI|nr:flagellar brake domain-containing protein [Aquibacillus albus]MBM7569808.1 c-di-GMP-binding flagellar brake protein YcgR [Aquibacillus albus]